MMSARTSYESIKEMEEKNAALQREIDSLSLINAENRKKFEAQMKMLRASSATTEILPAKNDIVNAGFEEGAKAGRSLKANTKVQTAFDEYVLVEQIGQGGSGRVFSAKNDDGDEFAIKFLDRRVGKTKLKRFRNEIYFCEHSSHPNIVRVIDRGLLVSGDVEYVFCVMPLYDQSLRDRINAGIDSSVAVEIFIALLRGLQYAHEKDIIHRDIKPENIMFAKNSNVPVICDFGIAHFSVANQATFVVTKTTDRLANFQYAAPEQRGKGHVTPQTDIFSLGLILNEMFTHSIPQGLGYTTIQSVAPEYDYLDELFSMLYRQNPQERLYPEEKILANLKALSERKGNGSEIKQL